jgi:hypothetical protein
VVHFLFSSEGSFRQIMHCGSNRDRNSGYIHSCALIYASVRLLYHILHLLHACFWLKIASLVVIFKMPRTLISTQPFLVTENPEQVSICSSGMSMYVIELILENTSQMIPQQTHNSKFHYKFHNNEVFCLEFTKR